MLRWSKVSDRSPNAVYMHLYTRILIRKLRMSARCFLDYGLKTDNVVYKLNKHKSPAVTCVVKHKHVRTQ